MIMGRQRTFIRALERAIKKQNLDQDQKQKLILMVNANEDADIINAIQNNGYRYYLYPDKVVPKGSFLFTLEKDNGPSIGFLERKPIDS